MDLGRIRRGQGMFNLDGSQQPKKKATRLHRSAGPKTNISNFTCGTCGISPAGLLKRVTGAEYVCGAACLRRLGEKASTGQDRGFIGYPRGLENPGWTGSDKFGKCGVRSDLGHYVRSRWEANVGRWLLWQKLEYCYEPQVFDLDGEGYCPDFWVRDWRVWFEVKGLWHARSRRKVKNFLQQNPKDRLVIVDAALYQELGREYKSVFKAGDVKGLLAWEN